MRYQGQISNDRTGANSPVAIANSQLTAKPTISATQVVKISSNVTNDDKMTTGTNMPIKVQILPHHSNTSKLDQTYVDIKQPKGTHQPTQPAVVVKPPSCNAPVQVISANSQSSAKAQTNQTTNIISGGNTQQSSASQQPMITFQIVQNSKTGTIEFIPVGPSNGKTQIQIIPKPVQPKARAPAAIVGETAQAPGDPDGPAVAVGKNQISSSVATPSKKSKSKKPCSYFQNVFICSQTFLASI